MEDYIGQAFKAYFRDNRDELGRELILDQPSNASDIEYHKGDTYVVLRNCNGILAVYRVMKRNGRLKRLDGPPEGCEKKWKQ